MSRFLFLTVLVLGCSEYNFAKPDDDDEGSDAGAEEDASDSGAPSTTDSGSTTNPEDPPPDTGSPFDPPVDEPVLDACPPLETDESVDIDESCVADPSTGPLAAWMEWEMTSFDDYPEYDEMVTTPIVGQFTDDNGDGLIDEHDVPDIIATFDDDDGAEDKFGVLRRISGDGRDTEALIVKWNDGTDDWGPYRYGTAALGDVDNDGETEIVVVLAGPPALPAAGPPPDGPGEILEPPPEDHPIGPPPPPFFEEEPDISCYPAAFSTEGVLEWVYEGSFIDCGGHSIALADLEGDGTVEVVLGKVIVNGEDGTLQAEGWGGDASYGGAYFELGQIPAIADIDGDGDQEVLAGYSIYNADGSEHCSLWDPSNDGFTAVADLDMDGDGEIVMVWDHKISIIDHNCHVTREWPMVGVGTGGPPTIADFDADGVPEIGVASANDYCVYEADGSAMLWAFGSTDESSHATGSTVYDFEGDGRPEVVYGDEVSLWVLDGLTGEVRWEDTRHTSRTLHEYPIVVDVDGDGYPEIVVPNGGGHYSDPKTGLFVLGSDAPGGRGWLGGRQVWNQHAYNIVNVNDDLSIPTVPESNWPYHNNFRSGDVNPVYADNAPDAVPLVDSCPWDCDDGVLRLQIRLANQGTATLRHDMKLTVYDTETDDPIVMENISPPIEPGQVSSPFEYAFGADTIGPEGLYVVVDDAEGVEAVRECDEDNNEVYLPEATCM